MDKVNHAREIFANRIKNERKPLKIKRAMAKSTFDNLCISGGRARQKHRHYSTTRNIFVSGYSVEKNRKKYETLNKKKETLRD